MDYADRNAAADPAAYARGILQRANGHTVWLVSSPGYRTFDLKCEAIQSELAAARPGFEVQVTPNDDIYEFMGLTRFSP